MLNAHISIHIEDNVKVTPKFYNTRPHKRAFGTLSMEDMNNVTTVYLTSMSDIDSLINALTTLRHDFEQTVIDALSKTSI